MLACRGCGFGVGKWWARRSRGAALLREAPRESQATQCSCFVDEKERTFYILRRSNQRKLHSDPSCTHIPGALQRNELDELEVCKTCNGSINIPGLHLGRDRWAPMRKRR